MLTDRQTDRGGCVNKCNMCPKVTVVSIRPSQRERERGQLQPQEGEGGPSIYDIHFGPPTFLSLWSYRIHAATVIASSFGPNPHLALLCVDMMKGGSELFDLSSSFTLGLPLLSSPLSFLSPCMAMMTARAQLADIQWFPAVGWIGG